MEELEEPTPAAGQVLIRVHAAGVNPVETYVRAGLGARPSLPYTPGTDAAGEVMALGLGAEGLRVGERVYTHGSLTGTYAELTLCVAADVAPLPPVISFAQGAAVGIPYATAFRALFQRGRARAGETVLVHGASGGVGIAAVQLAVAQGLAVIASVGGEDGRRLVLDQGAAHVVDHLSPGHYREVLELTGGRGVDVILEMRSDVHLGADLSLLAVRGRVMCIGNRGPGNEGEVAINARHLMRCEGEVLGVMLPQASAAEMAAIHRALADGLRSGALCPVVGRCFPLDEAAAAHHHLSVAPALGKLVLKPREVVSRPPVPGTFLMNMGATSRKGGASHG